jgi:Zn-dependent protease
MSERETPPREHEPDWQELYERVRADDEALAQREYEPIHPEPGWRVFLRRLWAPIAALGFLIWKFKFAFVAIFKLKAFTTAGSMLVSIGAYALIWGWKFALGFVLLIFVHEMGHALEARRQGLDVSAPVFIPFLGAAILLKEQPQDVWREFKIAAAGPILGSVGAVACLAVYGATDRTFWLALAFVGFFLNLFNLAPIWQLDGGRMVSAIHPGLWIPGLILVGGLVFVYPSPILILILILGVFQAWSWWRSRGAPGNERYYAISRARRTIAAVVYVGLLAALAIATGATHLDREV